jgi:hypothetical protein
MEKSKKYRMAESLDATSVKAFAQAVIDGTANVSVTKGRHNCRLRQLCGFVFVVLLCCQVASSLPLVAAAQVEYKSAPIPEDNKDDHVTIVVGKTVESIVFDESKDVLLEVLTDSCAPDCQCADVTAEGGHGPVYCFSSSSPPLMCDVSNRGCWSYQRHQEA